MAVGDPLTAMVVGVGEVVVTAPGSSTVKSIARQGVRTTVGNKRQGAVLINGHAQWR